MTSVETDLRLIVDLINRVFAAGSGDILAISLRRRPRWAPGNFAS
jgi:hypothetical protein